VCKTPYDGCQCFVRIVAPGRTCVRLRNNDHFRPVFGCIALLEYPNLYIGVESNIFASKLAFYINDIGLFLRVTPLSKCSVDFGLCNTDPFLNKTKINMKKMISAPVDKTVFYFFSLTQTGSWAIVRVSSNDNCQCKQFNCAVFISIARRKHTNSLTVLITESLF